METLDYHSQVQLTAALGILAVEGPRLGRPLVDRVKSSRFSHMKELRPPSSGRTAVRVLFAFDPNRVAIMLVGGDKHGQWNRWYLKNVPLADQLYARRLASSEGFLQ